MLYILSLIIAIGVINFPVGVLIYWFTSNLWSMGQQFYVIRRNPAPGTPAYVAWEERHQRHQRHHTEAAPAVESTRRGVAVAESNGNGTTPPPRAAPHASCGSSRASRPGR